MTAEEAASACGVSRQTIQSWYNEGLPRKCTQKELLNFLAHRTGYAAGSERERLARAQAEKFELENSRRRGELVLVSVVVEILMGMAADLTGRLEGIPGRLANELAGISDAAVIRARLLEEIRAVRAGAAEYIRKLEQYRPALSDASDDVGSASSEEPGSMGGRKARASSRKRRAGSVEK